MIKQTVSYEDFNGNQKTEDLYFHMRKMDLVDMEITEGMSMSERLNKISKTQNAVEVKDLMKKLVLDAYGIRTEDGRFIKNNKIREEFESSEAYSEFMWSLISDASKAATFMTNLMPSDFVNEAIRKNPEDGKKLLSQLSEVGVDISKYSPDTPVAQVVNETKTSEPISTPTEAPQPVSSPENVTSSEPAQPSTNDFDPSKASREELEAWVANLNKGV